MRFKRNLFAAVIAVLFVGALSTDARAEIIYGIQTSNNSSTAAVVGLVSFDSATPGAITPIGPFTNVVAGHTVRSIDFRPVNGLLYAVSSNGTAAQLYIVNLTNAALIPVGTGFTLVAGDPVTDINRVEIDFNPVADAIRVLTGVSLDAASNPVANNFRLNPNTGALIATDSNLNYVAGDVNGGLANMQLVAAAYSNPTPMGTTLYGWDWSEDNIVRIGSINGTPDSPNTGRMTTIRNGPPFITSATGDGIGMDFGPSGTLYVTRDNGTAAAMGLYTMDPASGTQTLIGTYGAAAAIFISDIAAQRIATAAEVEVSGRVFTSDGRGLSSASVLLTDSMGNTRQVFTGGKGRYTFTGVEAGQTYTLRVESKRFTFAPRVIEVSDSISDADFHPESGRMEREIKK